MNKEEFAAVATHYVDADNKLLAKYNAGKRTNADIIGMLIDRQQLAGAILLSILEGLAK